MEGECGGKGVERRECGGKGGERRKCGGEGVWREERECGRYTTVVVGGYGRLL